MRNLNYELKQLCRRNRDGSYATQRDRQRTLVLIKPDNFRFATGRPGNVIDFFSRTGLYIVGIKVHRMSTADAMEFYGPVREVLRTKLKDVVAAVPVPVAAVTLTSVLTAAV